MNKNILVIAAKNDVHVDAVVWGIAKLGSEAQVWYWEDFPCFDRASLSIGAEGRVMFTLRQGERVVDGPFDAVWLRRYGEVTPMAESHPDDLDLIQLECRKFLQNTIPYLGHAQTRWVNEFYAEERAELKAIQLMSAVEVGFTIPETLVSNDFREIKEFFQRHNKRVIYKGFHQKAWENPNGSRTFMRTALIDEALFGDPFAFEAAAAIYQPYVDKSFELRVTVIGGEIFAGKIDSQSDGQCVDWRSDGKTYLSGIKACTLSEETAAKCRALCNKLNLTFGCIDLIVQPSGKVVFLEVNPSGQFLWKEIEDPEIAVLDSFCRYLVEPDIVQGPVTWAEYYSSLSSPK
jgi:glutathione synthase/RimK-type ligase-like ATP-grasp enzyme